MYLVTLSDFDNLRLGKRLEYFWLSFYGCSLKTFDYTS